MDIVKGRKGEFWSALHEAQTGEKIVYSRGVTCTGYHRVDAMEAYNRGLVALVQRRNGPANFSYIAIKLKTKGSPR